MYIDEQGVQYSDNKKTLIRIPQDFVGEYNILEGVENIGYGALAECAEIESLTIPCSLSSKEVYGRLEDCEGLCSIKVTEGHSSLKVVDGILFNKEMTYILRYPPKKRGTSYVLPKGIKGIGYAAFAYCDALESIEISDTLEDIDASAFLCCFSLKTFIVPPLMMEAIAPLTFAGCIQLTSVQLPDNLKKIDYMAFNGCQNLKSINLPKSLETVANHAFLDCVALQQTETYQQLLALGYSDDEDLSDELDYEDENIADLEDLY